MEEAFKGLLETRDIAYSLEGKTHWTQKDRFDILIGGCKYDIKGCCVKNTHYITGIENDPGWFLDCSALVPTDQLHSRSLTPTDYYVFPFLIGRELPSADDLSSLFGEYPDKYLIHLFWKYAWCKNKERAPLGKLVFKNNSTEIITLEIGGQDENKDYFEETLEIKPKRSRRTKAEFSTVLFLHSPNLVQGPISIESEKAGLRESVKPEEWENIWFYDGYVFFTGYIAKGDFLDKSKEIPRFYKECKQYGDTQTENNMMLIKELLPLKRLLSTTGGKRKDDRKKP